MTRMTVEDVVDRGENAKEGKGKDGGEKEWKSLPRKVLLGLSSVGLLETMFLTYKKMFGDGLTSICATAGCLEVLGGPYSMVFGLPLTIFGMGGYAAALMLSLYPLLSQSEIGKCEETSDCSSYDALQS